MQTEKLGISNLKPILFLAIEMGNVGDQMGRTEGAARYGKLLGLADEVMGLASVDFSKVKAEFKDLDEAEIAELKADAKVKFNIVDDKLEMAIEEGLDILERQYGIVQDSIALAKKLKGE